MRVSPFQVHTKTFQKCHFRAAKFSESCGIQTTNRDSKSLCRARVCCTPACCSTKRRGRRRTSAHRAGRAEEDLELDVAGRRCVTSMKAIGSRGALRHCCVASRQPRSDADRDQKSFVICLLIRFPCRNSFLCRQTVENKMVRAAATIAERLLFLIGCRPGLLCAERERKETRLSSTVLSKSKLLGTHLSTEKSSVVSFFLFGRNHACMQLGQQRLSASEVLSVSSSFHCHSGGCCVKSSLADIRWSCCDGAILLGLLSN